MNAFEHIVGLYLQEKNYWIRHSVWVEITREDKVKLKKPAMPRPEIDLVAYNPVTDNLILVEAKSYLNGPGVTIRGLNGSDPKTRKRYRLLNDKVYQKIITRRLLDDFRKRKIIKKTTTVKYALAAGNVQEISKPKVVAYLEKMGYLYFDPADIQKIITNLAKKGWEDDIVTITAKLVVLGNLAKSD